MHREVFWEKLAAIFIERKLEPWPNGLASSERETCVGWPNGQASFLTSTHKSKINPFQGRHFLYFIGY